MVNYIGSTILIIALIYFKDHKSPKWWWRPAIATGFCGGFTTYSAFALKMDQYFAHQQYGTAITYALASIIGTYLLVFVAHEALKNRWVK
jgi:CrcB protein